MIPLYDTRYTRSFPFATLLLLCVNVAIFVGWQLQIGLSESVRVAAVVPAAVTNHPGPLAISSLFTSMFLHGGWMHLGGNMWLLLIFGNSIEDRIGRLGYILFYLLCGCAGAIAHIAFQPDSTVPLVGASGAVSGVLGGYLIANPRARIATLLPLGPFTRVFEVPAFIILGFWLLIQVLVRSFEMRMGIESNIAYIAHIGGFLAGILLIFCFKKQETAEAAA